jgi:tRNA(Glu) U13 pseudouridine synthase TruD
MNREQLKKLERDLWAAADKLCANSDLKASEYSTPAGNYATSVLEEILTTTEPERHSEGQAEGHTEGEPAPDLG